MGEAYVRFALESSWHYRVMFGGGFELDTRDPELTAAGAAAFTALVDALLEQQAQGRVAKDDPQTQATFVWAVVHGIAMLAIDGNLKERGADLGALTRYSLERLRSGISAE
jgi:hypothetical protein